MSHDQPDRANTAQAAVGLAATRSWLFPVGALLVVVLGIAWIVVGPGAARSRASARILQIEIRASAGTAAQIYWEANGSFGEEHSLRAPLHPSDEDFERLRFPLPKRLPPYVRFDPIDAPGEAVIRAVRVTDSAGHTLATAGPSCLWPMNQVASLTRLEDLTHIVTKGADLSVLVPAACLQVRSGWHTLFEVSPLSVALVSLVATLLLAACLTPLAVEVLCQPAKTDGGSPKRAPSLRPALWLATLLLVTFAAKLLLMRQFPAPVPVWDQWDAEGRALYVPFHEGWLSWSAMFSLHNEHRIFFTRLLALALFLVNGQWDPQLQQVVNALLHASAAVVVAAVFWVTGRGRWMDLLVLVGGLTFALPFSWENTLSGFQSQFYFHILFATLTFWLMGTHRVGTWQWVLGWACAFCDLFTVAGGLLTPIALGATFVFRLLGEPRRRRESLTNVAAAGVVAAIGFAIASPPLSHHAVYKARTSAEFAMALGRNLAWPWIEWPWLSIALWAPVALLALAVLLRRRRFVSFDQMTLAFGALVALEAAAIAYGRGVNGQGPASRYMDTLSLGFLANTMALLSALDAECLGRLRRVPVRVLLASWLVLQMMGIGWLTQTQLPGAAVRRQWIEAYVQNIGGFMIDDDLAAFSVLPFPFAVPHYDPPNFAIWLRHPYLRRILPASIREPVHMEAGPQTGDAFVRDGVYPTTPRSPLARVWGSHSSRGDAAQGRFETQRIAPCQLGRRLRFEVAGYLGRPGLRLAIKDLGSGRELEVWASEVAGERWIPTSVPCPAGPFTVVAEDATPRYWFAFREPVEIGWASVATEWLISWSRRLLLVALALGFLVARFV